MGRTCLVSSRGLGQQRFHLQEGGGSTQINYYCSGTTEPIRSSERRPKAGVSSLAGPPSRPGQKNQLYAFQCNLNCALSRNIIPSSHLSLVLRVAFCHPALILQSLVRRSSLVTLVGSLPVIQAGSGRPFDAENLNMKIAGSLKFALPALLVLASLGALFFSERCHVIH